MTPEPESWLTKLVDALDKRATAKLQQIQLRGAAAFTAGDGNAIEVAKAEMEKMQGFSPNLKRRVADLVSFIKESGLGDEDISWADLGALKGDESRTQILEKVTAVRERRVGGRSSLYPEQSNGLIALGLIEIDKNNRFLHRDSTSLAKQILYPQYRNDPKKIETAKRWVDMTKRTIAGDLIEQTDTGHATSVGQLMSQLKEKEEKQKHPNQNMIGFYTYASEEYSNMKSLDFVEGVFKRPMGRYAEQRSETRKEKREAIKPIEPRKFFTERNVPAVCGVEQYLRGRLSNQDVSVRIMGEVLDGRNPENVLVREGIVGNGELSEALNRSCRDAAQKLHDSPVKLNEDQLKILIAALVRDFTNVKIREDWKGPVKGSQYMSIQALYTLTGQIVGNVSKADRLIAILNKRDSYVDDGYGGVGPKINH